jgi:hypothetical protein
MNRCIRQRVVTPAEDGTIDGVIPSTAGQSILDLRRSLEEMVGADVVARALAGLPPEVGRQVIEARPLGWVPVSVVGRAVDAIAREAGREPEAMLDEAVRRATERTFKTVWRIFLRLSSDAQLIARTPVLYAKSRNVGRLEARWVAPGEGELILHDWPGVSPRHRRTLAVSVQTVMELCGRRHVAITFHPTPDGARYRVTWK